MSTTVKYDLEIENAKIMYRNFKGEEKKYNRAGDRNFNVVFDIEQGLEVKALGWNVNPMYDQDEELIGYKMKVKVAFGKIPPRITTITGRKRVDLNEATVKCLDHAELECVDLIIRPYNWTVGGGSGTAAYLKEMYAVVKQNRFADKYAYLDEEEVF